MRANTALRQQIAATIQACEDKKASDLSVLEMDKNAGAFTDYFVICSGSNPRQIQAITDDIRDRLHAMAVAPKSVEGYNLAEWVLMDYVDFVVHIFSESARKFYDLERLWKTATRVEPVDLEKPEPRKVAVKRTVPTKTAAAAHSQKKAKGAARTSKRARKS